jgi:phage N-6-adenine-methyltransferase
MNTDVMFSSKTDMWETPQALFDELNAEFCFTVDTCATSDNAKCDRYFTKEMNGLDQPWDEPDVYWVNPPYGRVIGEWVRKAYRAEATVVMLLPARTDTHWFHDYIYHKAEIRFIKGRLKFGGHRNSAPFPSMIVVFRR